MPLRKEILSNNNYYHIFNKTIDSKQIFNSKSLLILFKNLLEYYISDKSIFRYSVVNKDKNKPYVKKILQEIKIDKNWLVEIYSYCLMPNHFHLLLKQKKENGIIIYLQKILNAFVRTYNQIFDRKGPLFIPRFKAVQIYSIP